MRAKVAKFSWFGTDPQDRQMGMSFDSYLVNSEGGVHLEVNHSLA